MEKIKIRLGITKVNAFGRPTAEVEGFKANHFSSELTSMKITLASFFAKAPRPLN